MRKAAESHTRLAQPDASDAADLVRREMAFASRMAADPALLGGIIFSGTLAHGQLRLQLNQGVIAAALKVS